MFLAGFEFLFGIVVALFALFIILPIAIKIFVKFFTWFALGALAFVGYIVQTFYHNPALLMIFAVLFAISVINRLTKPNLEKEKAIADQAWLEEVNAARKKAA
jgi:hypothetical protein